jgi:hypothetical protein
MPAGCGKFIIKRTLLGAYVMDMSCVTPTYSMTVRSVATGDFQTHVSSDSTMTMSGKLAPARTMKMHNKVTWVGSCAPGQTPADAGYGAPG